MRNLFLFKGKLLLKMKKIKKDRLPVTFNAKYCLENNVILTLLSKAKSAAQSKQPY